MATSLHRFAYLAAAPAVLVGAAFADAQSLRPATMTPARVRPMPIFNNPMRPAPQFRQIRTGQFAFQPVIPRVQLGPNGVQVPLVPLSPGFVAHQQRLFMREAAVDTALLARSITSPYNGGYYPMMNTGYGGGSGGYGGGYGSSYGGGYYPMSYGGGYGGGYSQGSYGGSPYSGSYSPPMGQGQGSYGGGGSYGGAGDYSGQDYGNGGKKQKSDYGQVAKRDATKDASSKLLTALSVPNEDGKLSWPLGLRVLTPQSKCEELQDRIETLLLTAANQQDNGKVNTNLLDEAAGAVEGLAGMLKARQSNMMPDTYSAADQYLGKLRHAIKMLRPA
jgi:hypothetical protein